VSGQQRTAELEAIERASEDELRALQLQRLRWSVRHAYENVPVYRGKCQGAGVHRTTSGRSRILSVSPSCKGRSAARAIRSACSPCRASRWSASTPRAAPPASRPWWATPAATSTPGGAGGTFHPCRGRAPRRHGAHCLWLRTVHRGLGAHYGAELLGCTVVPMSGGQTQRQVQLICDFRPDIIMVTPSYMLSIVEEFMRQGLDPAASSLRTGIFGAEPWTEALRAQIESRAGLQALDIYGLSEVMGPGWRASASRARMGRSSGGSFLSGDRRPGDRGGAARWRAGRAGAHLAHQGSPAGDPLTAPTI